MAVGISSIGAYIPYYYMKRETIAANWETRGAKGERSVANVDEDSLTMAVEAAMGCLRHLDRTKVNALYFASTTAPYAEKSNAALIAVACDLGRDVFASDMAHCTRAGTNALKSAWDMVAANPGQSALVAGADCRNAYPKSGNEQMFADAAAAVTVGDQDVLAAIDHFTSINDEIVDIWRNPTDQYVNFGEGRFIFEEGYLRVMTGVIKQILKETGLKTTDIDRLVVSAPGAKEAKALLKKTGFTEEQLQENFLSQVGNCGTAQSLLGLIGALEKARAGERILLADYGNGANAFLFTVTEQVKKIKNLKAIGRFLDKRRELQSYARFLSFRGIVEAQPSSPFKLPASAAMTWREQDSNIRLRASKCRKCGAGIFPINRVCHACGSKDEFDTIRASDKVTSVFTYSIDNYAGRSDDPVIVQTVSEDEHKIRYYLIMTDFVPSEVEVDMKVEFTFRKMHTLGNFNNYYWKLRPVRREKG